MQYAACSFIPYLGPNESRRDSAARGVSFLEKGLQDQEGLTGKGTEEISG